MPITFSILDNISPSPWLVPELPFQNHRHALSTKAPLNSAVLKQRARLAVGIPSLDLQNG